MLCVDQPAEVRGAVKCSLGLTSNNIQFQARIVSSWRLTPIWCSIEDKNRCEDCKSPPAFFFFFICLFCAFNACFMSIFKSHKVSSGRKGKDPAPKKHLNIFVPHLEHLVPTDRWLGGDLGAWMSIYGHFTIWHCHY